MNFKKIVTNKYVVGTALMLGPTLLILGIMGYHTYSKNKAAKKATKEQEELDATMREKYKTITTPDEFILGVKYLQDKEPFGFSLQKLEDKKDILDKFDFTQLKEIYALLQKGTVNNTELENKLVQTFLDGLFNNTIANK